MENGLRKTYRFDMHNHSCFSHDCNTRPEDLVASAKEKGLNGIAITDHDNSKCVEYFLNKGYMTEDGQSINDFLIIPGQEISTSSGHLLTYGAKLPNLRGISPERAIRLVRAQKGLCFPAHPYDRFRSGICESIMNNLDIDGIEGFNAAATFRKYNDQAISYAKQKNIPAIAGSDSHDSDTVGTAYTELKLESLNLTHVLSALKVNPMMHCRYISIQQSFNKTFGLLFPKAQMNKLRPIKQTLKEV